MQDALAHARGWVTRSGHEPIGGLLHAADGENQVRRALLVGRNGAVAKDAEFLIITSVTLVCQRMEEARVGRGCTGEIETPILKARPAHNERPGVDAAYRFQWRRGAIHRDSRRPSTCRCLPEV